MKNADPGTPEKGIQPGCVSQDLFVLLGRHHYRIPVIAVDPDGHIICFANCRMDTAADGAREVGLVCRRKDPDTATWSPMQNLFARDGWDAAIGTATVDHHTGTILLSYYRQGADSKDASQGSETVIHPGSFQVITGDGGLSWVQTDLSTRPNAMGLVGSSHGSSTGITLKHGRYKGRLLVPARFQRAPGEALETLQHHHYNCAMFSDDRGKTWKTSEPVQVGTGEGCLVELADGRIYYNSRAYFLDGRRRIGWSYDGGETFTDFDIDKGLTEPFKGGCNAGMALYSSQLSNGKDIILFSNPAGEERERMTVRASFDGGQTWPVSKTIYAGPSAYSSMAVGADGMIYVLFENGIDHPYEKITLARFDLQWVLQV